MKNSLISLTVIIWIMNGVTFADQKQDKAMVERFFQFNPAQNQITDDIAKCSFVAYFLDNNKTITKLTTWPKAKLMELKTLAEALQESMWAMEGDRSMAFYRTAFVFLSELNDLTGSIIYTDVIVGRLGEYVPSEEDIGWMTPECYKFHMDGKAAARNVCFGSDMLGWRMINSCNDNNNRLLRLHLLDKEAVGKIEALEKCSAN